MSIFQLFRYADHMDKLLLFFGTLGSIGDGLMNPLSMFVLSEVIDEYGSADASFSIHIADKYALKLLLVAIGVGISAFVEGICWTRTAQRQTSRIKKEYLKSVLRQDVSFYDTHTTTSATYQVITTISSDSHSIQDVLCEKIPNCLTHLTSFIFSLLVAFSLSWRSALLTLPFSLMFIVPGVGFGKIIMNLGKEMKEAYNSAGTTAEQAISSVRTVFSYAAEHQTLEKFSWELQQSMKLGVKQGLMKGILIGSMGMIFATWALQSWIGSILVTKRGEKGGHIFVAGMCIIVAGLSIMGALPNITFFSQATATASQIYDMIDRLPLIDTKDEEGDVLAHVNGELEFKNVTFSYPSRPDSVILQEFNLKVPAGETIRLVGASGSGKSTLISLLERFYDPIKGEILLDGYELNKLQLKWLRSQFGLVNQEPILFAMSIKDNILFGKEDASIDIVIKAAKDANAHDFISKLPKGYETPVGQFGLQLSGGQKQRIAIARALIRNPKILLLDEATSALDAQSEMIVQEALDKASLGRTTIIISHRLSTIHSGNFIVVIQSGKVIESGTHDELIQKNNEEGGFYSELLQLQEKMTQCEAPEPSYILTEGSPYSSITSMKSKKDSSPKYSLVPHDPHHDKDIQICQVSSPPPPSQWRLLKMNAPEWKRTLLGCLGAVGFGVVHPTHAYCLGSMATVYFLNDNALLISETRLYCFIFSIMTIVAFTTSLLQHYNFAIMGEQLNKRIREKMLEKVLSFEVGWFDQDENTSAAICVRLATEANMARSLIGDRISLVVQVLVSAFLAYVLALVVTWRLASVMIAMQPLLIACLYFRIVLMKGMSEKAQRAQTTGSQVASEAVVNHRTITAFTSQKRVVGLFEATLEGPHKASIKQSWLAGVALFSSQFFTQAFTALAFWYGGRLIAQKMITAKALFQAFSILMSTGRTIAEAGSMTSDLAQGGDAIRSIFAVLDRKSEIEPDDPKGLKAELKGYVELKDVFFCYPARPNQVIFDGLNLKIEAGKKMALVGQSGSGKSTVIALIERFYDPQKGAIEIDGQDIKSYNLRHLRSHIALVSQEPTLFAGTIHANITYGKENVTEAELKEAAILANAHEFVSAMKDGYETYCGEKGFQLSGGQKQRIALARAILKNPTILLLDEATSALDNVSENLIQDALDKMMTGRTCVVVSHRLSTIRNSEKIVLIKNGKVAEEGSHSSLLSIGHGGEYYSLIEAQGNTSYQ